MKYLFTFIFIHLINATPRINLYYTDLVDQNGQNQMIVQHGCVRLVLSSGFNDDYEMMSYCLSEPSWKFHDQNREFSPKFTFAQLAEQNITLQQLYLWSTPIDILERYQIYLDRLPIIDDMSLSREIFYNCTLPRFGPMCQYEFIHYHSDHSSFFDLITDFYANRQNQRMNLTCYTHLECNRGPFPSCLDWREICDGEIDCLNDGIDENDCWQLEINQCKDDEYRCLNGQCIPQSFWKDITNIVDCLDASDETRRIGRPNTYCQTYQQPSIACEDRQCQRTPLTSSCLKQRETVLLDAMYSNKDHSVSDQCWSAFKCLLKFPDQGIFACQELCDRNTCRKLVEQHCPDVLFFPSTPILFNDIYFAYRRNDTQYWFNMDTTRYFVCYTKSDYDHFFLGMTMIELKNKKCIEFDSLQSRYSAQLFSWTHVYPRYFEIAAALHKLMRRFSLVIDYSPMLCNRSTMYQCLHSSKCISIHRLMDSIDDCPDKDDENIDPTGNQDLMKQFKKTHFRCNMSNKYIHQSLVEDLKCDCYRAGVDWCEDEELHVNLIKSNILFQHICDGFADLLPMMINGRNETDETECQQWECNNLYTRCDNLWNCPNGVDESGCISYSTLNCSFGYHYCLSAYTKQFTCLPIEKSNDGQIDCLGATDEPRFCRVNIQSNYHRVNYFFYCMNESTPTCLSRNELCDGDEDCTDGDDEQFCDTGTVFEQWPTMEFLSADIGNFLSHSQDPVRSWEIIDFILDQRTKLVDYSIETLSNSTMTDTSITRQTRLFQSRCHRGLDLNVWSNNSTDRTCFCPPSYYGDQCQYQNERISLGIQFRALSDSWQTLFAIVISLIDDSPERVIHSYQQINFFSMRDCKTKFSMNLLYSTRPKDPSKNYSIHIDVYEKISLAYRGSIFFPIPFSFLPVHRLAFVVHIPRSNDKSQSCSDEQCIHGKCIRYMENMENRQFCRCDQGWTGRYCTRRFMCTCSADSACVGVSANNRSICVCPMNKFGSRCFLSDTIRQNNNSSPCQNGGQLIPHDEYLILNPRIICSCPKGFSGDQCESADNQLILSFDENIVISQQIFLHFIEVTIRAPKRATTFRMLPIKQDSMRIYWSQPFHLVFTEIFSKSYYLTVIQRDYQRSTTIRRTINPSDRCPHISELFNETFVQWHLLRRIKYYHLPCQQQPSNLLCFYDDVHLCLCYEYGRKRLANCLNFNHNMTFNCQGQSECENGAQCLQDRPDCPKRSICICPPCFYGTRCQFTTSGFGLSLDAILGYHILPHVRLTQQPFIVKMTFTWTIVFVFIGLINGILSLITFKNKSVHEVGCGLYLLSSSIMTLLTMTLFGLKFMILFLTQIATQFNRSTLFFQCCSTDFFLRVCLCLDQWLNACVAVERAATSVQGARFNKKKSKQMAKFIILSLLIMIIGTSIHDPIYRQLIDEVNNDENITRVWCITMHPPGVQVYNYIIHAFHFSVPFLMNFISAVILIRKQSRSKAAVCPQRTSREHFQQQFRQHKHLVTAPIVLVVLAVPRLIITFVSKCMESTADSWLFLVGYFLSFIPPMLTFVVFIVPSKFYKKILWNSLRQYRRNLRQRLPLN